MGISGRAKNCGTVGVITGGGRRRLVENSSKFVCFFFLRENYCHCMFFVFFR
jgi:hypothetical protein